MTTDTTTRSWVPGVIEELRKLSPGDRVKFPPKEGPRWWTVRAVSDRFVIATRKPAFSTRGNGGLLYTVVALEPTTGTYNGIGPGLIVRSSCDYIGGGFDIDADDPTPGCEALLAELESGECGLSLRRRAQVWGVEVRA